MPEHVWISRVAINGFRGFATEQSLGFAIPDGVRSGSGMTVLVGPNGGGKSSVVELIAHIGADQAHVRPLKPSMRNRAQDKVVARIETTSADGAAVLTNDPTPYLMSWKEQVPSGGRPVTWCNSARGSTT